MLTRFYEILARNYQDLGQILSRSCKILQGMCCQDLTRSWYDLGKILSRSLEISQQEILTRSWRILTRFLQIMAGSCQDIVKSCGKQDLGKIIHDLGKILPRFNQDKILPRSYKILQDLGGSYKILPRFWTWVLGPLLSGLPDFTSNTYEEC